MGTEKTIFFHVGTAKTGTTFLQDRIFPHFQGLEYITPSRFKRAHEILKSSDSTKFLLSREFDQQLESEVQKFSAEFPDTVPIIVFRRHDSYVASQYRRAVKNGFKGSFQEFFDLENDQGKFKIRDFQYMRQIRILEKYFTQPPLVLIYEDLREDPRKFILQLAADMKATVMLDEVNLNKKHSSYSEKQLKTIHALSQHIDLRKRRVFNNNVLHIFWRLGMSMLRYPTLYIGKIMPEALLSEKPLMEKQELEQVREYFAEDWQNCLAYAQDHTEKARKYLAAQVG